MISVEKGARVIVTTLSFYYDGIVDDFDGVWLKLTSPRVVFNLGNRNEKAGGVMVIFQDLGPDGHHEGRDAATDRVVCDGCGETRAVETQNTMRPGDWPVCRKADCPEVGQVMRLMEAE